MIKISNGNSKLVSTVDCAFLIWSIPPIVTCPYATEHCIKSCYAQNSYRMYPNVRKAWSGNHMESMSKHFVAEMIEAIEKQLNRKMYREAKRIVFRIHESGDFYSMEYLNKWLEIVNHFAYEKRLTFVAYTKSVRYFEAVRIPSNMAVRFSLWDDTEPSEYAIAKALNLPIYTAVEKFTNEPQKMRCRCKDCGHCRKCWNKNIDTILCEIH